MSNFRIMCLAIMAWFIIFMVGMFAHAIGVGGSIELNVVHNHLLIFIVGVLLHFFIMAVAYLLHACIIQYFGGVCSSRNILLLSGIIIPLVMMWYMVAHVVRYSSLNLDVKIGAVICDMIFIVVLLSITYVVDRSQVDDNTQICCRHY